MSQGTQLPRAISEMLEVLSLLVEQYESSRDSIRDASPAEALAHLMDARGVTNAALARELGTSRSVFTDILAARRNISTTNVAKLSDYFNVVPGVFIANVSESPDCP